MQEQAFSREEARAMARGLYWLANVDGIDDAEVDLVREFLEESGSGLTLEDVQTEDFDPRELPVALETSFLRRSFLKAAVALIAADGKITAREGHALRRCARLLGLSDQAYAELEEEARKLLIERAGQQEKEPRKKNAKK